MKNKVGLLILAEGYAREGVYRSRYPAETRENALLKETLARHVDLVCTEGEDVRGKKDLIKAMDHFRAEGVESLLISVPTFLQASLAAVAVRLSPVPCAVMGNSAPDTYSQVGFMAAAGAIEQAGLPYLRMTGDIREEETIRRLMHFFTACHAKKMLEGMTYGLFGGRSLGISTGTADTAQWLREFGIDIEQIDQLQIVQRAQKIDREQVEETIRWIREKYGRLSFEEGKFDEPSLERMVRSYLAVKQIIAESELDFVGIKCQPDLSNGYVLQCLTVQLLNDPYDASGQKNPVVCSCEADCDGALTMQILNLLSGGRPTALQDIFYYDKEGIVLANCGSSASYFAAHADRAEENLKEVHLISHGFGDAGGAATQFPFAPGVYTYARLLRKNGKYQMALSLGEAQPITREDLSKYVWYRPTAVVKGIDTGKFAKEFGCNHVHCVTGDVTKEAEAFCALMNIPVIRMDEEH